MNARPLATATLCLALAACGGGGDPVFADPFDADAAWRNVLAANTAFSLSGIGSDNASYTLSVALAPAGPGIYPRTGELGARAVQTTQLVQNGAALPPTTTVQFYEPASAALLGVTSDDGACATVTGNGVRPIAAVVGSSGPLYTATTFDSCGAGAAVIGSVSSSWSIETEAGIVFFCSTATQFDTAGNDVGAESDCLQIGIDGSLGALARVTVVLPPSPAVPTGFSLVARNY